MPILCFQGPAIPGLLAGARDRPRSLSKSTRSACNRFSWRCSRCEGRCGSRTRCRTGEPCGRSGFEFRRGASSRARRVRPRTTPFSSSCSVFRLDLQNTPKEVAEYMTKIGARVPNVRPGGADREGTSRSCSADPGSSAVCCWRRSHRLRFRRRAHAPNHRDLRRVHVYAHRDVHDFAD